MRSVASTAKILSLAALTFGQPVPNASEVDKPPHNGSRVPSQTPGTSRQVQALGLWATRFDKALRDLGIELRRGDADSTGLRQKELSGLITDWLPDAVAHAELPLEIAAQLLGQIQSIDVNKAPSLTRSAVHEILGEITPYAPAPSQMKESWRLEELKRMLSSLRRWIEPEQDLGAPVDLGTLKEAAENIAIYTADLQHLWGMKRADWISKEPLVLLQALQGVVEARVGDKKLLERFTLDLANIRDWRVRWNEAFPEIIFPQLSDASMALVRWGAFALSQDQLLQDFRTNDDWPLAITMMEYRNRKRDAERILKELPQKEGPEGACGEAEAKIETLKQLVSGIPGSDTGAPHWRADFVGSPKARYEAIAADVQRVFQK